MITRDSRFPPRVVIETMLNKLANEILVPAKCSIYNDADVMLFTKSVEGVAVKSPLIYYIYKGNKSYGVEIHWAPSSGIPTESQLRQQMKDALEFFERQLNLFTLN